MVIGKIKIILKEFTILNVILLCFLLSNSSNAQRKEDLKSENNHQISDYKIISSGESFFEIEFTPEFDKNYGFKNAESGNIETGYPDIRQRTFPVILPSGRNNIVEILDSRYEDVQNIEINPVPTFKLNDKEKARKNGETPEYTPEYIKDSKAYSINKYMPENISGITEAGIIRNKNLGYLSIFPLQYNPATNTIRKYSYIRVRISFGDNPVYSNKSLSNEEREFFREIALNSNTAANWSTNEFNGISDSPVQNSVLATGEFYKIEIKESGIYKLDKNYLQSNSINVSSIDPRTIKIYGNGGSELPYNNSIVSPVDPVENRIYIEGEGDGRFDNNDYVLFYGRSPNEWVYENNARTFSHKINNYSKSNYYWITFGGSNGKRIETLNSPNQSGLNPISSFKDRFFEEPDVNNLGSTGLLWVSQRIGLNEAYSFNKELKGYVTGSDVNFRFRFGCGSSYPASAIFRLEDLNSNFLLNQSVQGVSGFSKINLVYLANNQYGVYYPLSPGKNSINFKASLPASNGNTSNSTGYYDYYECLYDRSFIADNNQLRFNSPDTNATVEFRISNFNSSDVKIFEISDQDNINLINPISYSNSQLTFQSNIVSGNPKEYYTIGGDNFKTPVSVSSRVPNQNLKGQLADGASFIIISPKEFISAANRLKAHREKPGVNYIKTAVVDIEDIYNEFSGGMQDPIAVRNFLKYSFNNWTERPVYVFFMGDGSYDYKNIYNLYNSGIKNWLPPIEKNSQYSDDVESYCSDDFFLEINENYTNPIGGSTPDFASGRVCVNSLNEANIAVDKIFAYEDAQYFDKWKNTNMYVGDDGWTTEQVTGGEGNLHTQQCEDVAQDHSPSHIKKEKIYIVSYPTEITPQGRRKPGANTDIIDGWNEGRLVINYTGHGSVDLWAHEHIFVRQVSIPLLNNKNKYPFLTIASCDLARWDDPFLLSAGEQLVNLQDKGAIGVAAAVRPVYATENAIFNNLLYDNMYKEDTLNLKLRLGKAMYNVKQSRRTDNDLKFALVCDPTVRLAVPQYRTKIDSINSSSGDDLFYMKALQKIKISGSILRSDSSFWNDYNGTIDITVFDVNKNISIQDFGYSFNYELDGGIIYKGTTSVVNGNWKVDYVVPRDISYDTGRGKIITYFKNNFSDGVGFSDNFVMSGLDTSAVADSTGPVISIYADSRNFRSGDMINQNPKLIVDFTDQSGINLTGTIGHKIEAIINDDENNKIDLTALYSSNSGFENGTVEYQMQNLADGKYKLQVNAWDTYNNFSSAVIDFIVKGNNELVLDNIYNYPNPMQDYTNFTFQHNFDSPITADIKIYTVSGRLIKELNKANITDKFVNIEWSGADSDGDAIANGTYIYKITIKTEDGAYTKSSTGKLAKLK
ncbi:MAG TPA: type IX secretion system sortase PorU [Ignavibacteria bacterium]|nr:type IX secretion system sortase PorU [Ignavibacteria bacterium]